MRGAIPPFRHTSSWCGAWVRVGKTLPLPSWSLRTGHDLEILRWPDMFTLDAAESGG